MALQLWKYNQKQNVKTTMDIAEITPVYFNKLYPGEEIKNFNYRNITRMITPIYPTLDAPYVDLYAFAVPYRLIQPANTKINPDYKPLLLRASMLDSLLKTYEHGGFKGVKKDLDEKIKKYYKFISDSNIGVVGFIKNNLKIDLNEFTFVPKMNLFKKLGVWITALTYSKDPVPGKIFNDYKLDCSYALAYKKIYSDFFRNKQLESTDYERIYNFLTNDNKDYDLVSARSNFSQYSNYRRLFNESLIIDGNLSDLLGCIYDFILACFLCLNVPNTDNDFLENVTFSPISSASYESSDSWNKVKGQLFSDFVKDKKILEQIDFATQKDLLLKVWNENNNDKTSAKLIGYNRWYQNISQVVNQSKDQIAGNFLGDIGGLSVTFNEGNLVSEFKTNEKCVFMVLAVPNYKLTFVNFADKDEFIYSDNANLEEDFNPAMEYTQRYFTKSEFLVDYRVEPSFSPKNIIGYKKPFDYLRKKPGVILGDIKNVWNNWTYSMEFKKDYVLGLNVLKSPKKPFKDTLVSSIGDSFIAEFEFSGQFNRTIKPDYIIHDEVLKGE